MKILIVDSNEVVRRQLFWALRKGHDLYEASSRAEAQSVLAQVTPDVIVTELLEEGDPDESAAVEMVERILAEAPSSYIIIITRSDRKDVHARLLEQGVLDVFHKPVHPDELVVVLRRAERLAELRGILEEERRQRPVGIAAAQARQASPDAELGIIGVDPRVKQIMEQVRRIAPTPVSVLITGETGTGKEVFAQAVHKLSDRHGQRFVPLNCAVLADNLVEDELFGHEKGAFTGAIDRRKGKFEYANHGTLFLDEIGDLGPGLQSKFLRVLQEKSFERLGGNQPIDTDFRLISATHRNLEQMTGEGSFREDLLFRINVVSFHLPPLRERRGDIKLLAQHFLDDYARQFGRPGAMSFSREVERFLYDHPWPGNIRELKHFVERAVALTEGRVIGTEVLPDKLRPAVPELSLKNADGATFERLVKEYKRQLVMEALEMAGHNKIQTAQLLGISRSYLFKMIKQLQIPN